MSRRSARSDKRDGTTGSGRLRGDRDHEYYDRQRQDDDAWSPDEYFSPDGISGRRPSDRGSRPGVPSLGDSRGGESRDAYGRAYGGDAYGGQYANSGYGDPSGAPGDAADRDADGPAWRGTRRRRADKRDKADKGERGLRRLVRRSERDAGIWPDDGVSDEDYWASVAADKPLPAADPEDATQVMPPRPAPRGTGSGRLGPAPVNPPPGPGADSIPGGAGVPRRTTGDTGIPGRLPDAADVPGRISGDTGISRRTTGDTGISRRASGDTGIRAGGPGPRADTGGRPAVGRPAAGIAQPMAAPPSQPNPTVAQPSLARGLPRPGSGPASAGQPRFQPSFQPNAPAGDPRDVRADGGYGGYGSYGGQAGYGDPSPYPDRYPDRVGPGTGAMPGADSAPGGGSLPGYGAQPATGGWGQVPPDSRSALPAGRPGTGVNDDPLTSAAYSRDALLATDGRSYRGASRPAPPPADPYGHQPPAVPNGAAVPRRALPPALPAAGSPSGGDGNAHLYTSQPPSSWPPADPGRPDATGSQYAVPSRGRHANRTESTGFSAVPGGYDPSGGYGGSPYGAAPGTGPYEGSPYGDPSSPYGDTTMRDAPYADVPYGDPSYGGAYGGYGGPPAPVAAPGGDPYGGTGYDGGAGYSADGAYGADARYSTDGGYGPQNGDDAGYPPQAADAARSRGRHSGGITY